MIIRLAGTSGSGKTTLIRELMEKRGAKPFLWPAVEDAKKPPKIRGYYFPIQEDRPAGGLIIGRYNLTTGGADNAFNKKLPNAEGVIRNSMERLQDEVEYFRNERGVPCIIFEGLIVSSVWGRWVRMSQEHPEYGMIFAFMDTSLDTCRRNVQTRNQGKPRSGNEDRQDRNLVSKFEACERQLRDAKGSGWKKWLDKGERPVTPVTEGALNWRIIRYEHALEDFEAIIDG